MGRRSFETFDGLGAFGNSRLGLSFMMGLGPLELAEVSEISRDLVS